MRILVALTILSVVGASVATEALSQYDVVVHAATPGGVMAAVAAAREGASVVLLEPSEYVGAMASSGLGQADYGQHSRSVLGGLCQEFYRRVATSYGVAFEWPGQAQCSEHRPPWSAEPHVSEQVFVDMLAGANVTVLRGARVVGVRREGQRVATVTCADGRVFSAVVFVDGSYEGALMKLAGIAYSWGREANTTYNESAAGRLPTLGEQPSWPFGDRSAQLPRGISPWTDATNATPIAGVWAGDVAPAGGADDRVGGYDWRLTLTDAPDNRVPLPTPEHYDPAEFELVRRALRRGFKPGSAPFNIPNRKTDWKMFGVFGEHPNAQWAYPNASWEGQQAVAQEFKRYALALLHFFRTDAAVPEQTRARVAALGLCRDEYNRSAHWMPQLYVREALRLVGKRVLTQADVVRAAWQPDGEGVGMGAYTVDVPGPVQIIVDPATGEVATEGALKVSPGPHPSFCGPLAQPFPLPYSIMVPRAEPGQVQNVLVPVAVSSSHVGFNAVRLEPTWMVLGQSAGVAAAMVAAGAAETVQALDVAALRRRLRQLGQFLEPAAPTPAPPTPPTPPPTPPAPLGGRQWYAYKPMWKVRGSGVITATQNEAVLKREFANSKALPPAEVRFFRANASVPLEAGAGAVVQASDPEYWRVTVNSTLALAPAPGGDRRQGGGIT